MTTENEQPAVEETGLDDDLGKVFDEVSKADEPEAPAKPEKPEEPKVEEPEAEEKASPEPKAEESPVTEEPPAEEPEESVAPPATWTADGKEKFGSLDPAIQQEVLKREKDFATGIQKNAEAAKVADAYEQVISPYKAMIAAEGSNPVQAIQSLLNTAYQLRSGTPEHKAKLILGLAQQYGADLSQVAAQEETDEYVDPDIQKLNQRLDTLQNTTQSQMQAAQNQQVQGYQQQIAAFAADPKNEHFDKVKDSMSTLLMAGQANNLDDAYNKSIYMVEEVRDTLVQKQIKDAETAKVKKESEAAEKAKKAAGTQLKDEGGAGTITPTDGTMEEELAAAFDKAEAKNS